jgi:excisionase family DNA binding protein
VGEDHTDAHSVGRGSARVTIREAATLLGVHPNTVRNRVKDGTYRAEKVFTERGETWMLNRDSLITNTPTRASQQFVNPQAVSFAQELLRPFVNELGEVREQLGAERARREQAERTIEELHQELDDLRQPLGSPETGVDATDRGDVPRDPGGAQQAQGPRLTWAEKRILGVLVAISIATGLLALAVPVLPP